jgi:16S rRNA (uracil1498-N3)-methyltransferase
MDTKVRLYLDHPIARGQALPPPSLPLTEAQANYLFNVMRLTVGARVSVFNGRDGEWLAEVAEAGKRRGLLVALEQTRDQQAAPDLWLVFAPIKKARLDFLVEKAVELGVGRLVPVQTRFTNAERIRQDRLQAHAIEAAEQCEVLCVPPVDDLQPLDRLLATWDPGRRLFWGDERGQDLPVGFPSGEGGPAAILIGPEGGFSPEEKTRLRGLDFVHSISLGPRILRAETAALAAICLWQKSCGDWR